VYVPVEGNVALVAATWNHGGLFAEKPDGVERCPASEVGALGQMISRKLGECEFREYFDYSRRRKSDWPSYQESDCKTLREFESAYIRYDVRGANEVNITWVVTSPELPNGIEMQASLSAGEDDQEIGRCVRQLHDFFLQVRQQFP